MTRRARNERQAGMTRSVAASCLGCERRRLVHFADRPRQELEDTRQELEAAFRILFFDSTGREPGVLTEDRDGVHGAAFALFGRGRRTGVFFLADRLAPIRSAGVAGEERVVGGAAANGPA